MVLFPNAKINIGLLVTGKRSDGYHNMESVLYPIPVYDSLELLPAPDQTFRFSSSGLLIDGTSSNNLCVKAWEILHKDFNLPDLHMHLHKVIPMGAGLGGGSADAAFAIKLINQVFELGLTVHKMEEYAAQLGMDCPFFIQNASALATERGDKLKSIKLDLSGRFLVLIKPNCHISTQDAYAGIEPAPAEISLKEIIHSPISEWKAILRNDFEKTVFQKFPEIKKIKEQLYHYGALYASMSGSGSAVYGIFEDKVELAEYFQDNFYWGGWLS